MPVIRSHTILVVSLLLLIVFILPGHVWAGQDNSLTVINGQYYSQQDFEHWWQYWRDEKSVFPDRPDKFIDWHIQVQEAERMELYTTPDVKRQLDVFIRARGLMKLKYDEVDSKIDISDADISTLYEQNYSPLRLVAALDFNDEKGALAAKQRFNSEKTGFDDLKAMAALDDSEFKLQQPQWLRPITTPADWFAMLRDKSAGSFMGPMQSGDKFMLLYLVDLQPGSEKDLAHKKKGIYNDIFSKRQKELTDNLLKRLKKIYNVKINNDLLEQIDLLAPKKENWDKVLVTSDLSTVNVGYFIEQCRKEQKVLQKQSERGRQMQASLKRRAMSAMISNSLVDWAVADRHYEEQPPFKWEYQFYRQGSLIKLLQKRMNDSSAVTEDVAEIYYNDHLSQFRSADMVKISLVHGDKDDINRLWGAGMASGELLKNVSNLKVKTDISATLVPLQHLSETVRDAISQLTLNDISSPFVDGGKFALVQLYERKPGRLALFPEVRDAILAKLKKDNNKRLRDEFIMKLRQRSSFTVNDEVWQKIKTEHVK